MSPEQQLLAEIESYCAAHGIAPSTLCQKAVKNSNLPDRLRAGKGVTVRIAQQVRAFIQADQPEASSPRAA